MKSVFRKTIVYLFFIIFVFLTQPFYAIAADDIDYHTMDYEVISSQIAKDVEEYHVPGMAVIVVDKDEVCLRKLMVIVKALIRRLLLVL